MLSSASGSRNLIATRLELEVSRGDDDAHAATPRTRSTRYLPARTSPSWTPPARSGSDDVMASCPNGAATELLRLFEADRLSRVDGDVYSRNPPRGQAEITRPIVESSINREGNSLLLISGGKICCGQCSFSSTLAQVIPRGSVNLPFRRNLFQFAALRSPFCRSCTPSSAQ